MDQRLLLMHQTMLADGPRMEVYDRAIERAVQGGVVADIGAGTLALSLMSLRHGAERVYAIEADPEMAAVAVKIAERNDLKGRLTIVQGDARTVRLPERADVVVSEMMGNLGPEEEMMEVLGAFAEHNLAPGGRVVPHRLVTHLAAIEFDREGWGLWDGDFLGYSLKAVQEFVEPSAQLHFFQRPPTMLSRPATVADQRPGRRTRFRPQEAHTLTVTRAGRLQAIVGYFTATFGDGLALSNFPSYPGCNWAVWVWPLRHTRVSPGELLRVRLRLPPDVRDATGWRLECSLKQRR